MRIGGPASSGVTAHEASSIPVFCFHVESWRWLCLRLRRRKLGLFKRAPLRRCRSRFPSSSSRKMERKRASSASTCGTQTALPTFPYHPTVHIVRTLTSSWVSLNGSLSDESDPLAMLVVILVLQHRLHKGFGRCKLLCSLYWCRFCPRQLWAHRQVAARTAAYPHECGAAVGCK